MIMRPATPEAPPNHSRLWRLIYRPDILTSVVYLITVAINIIIRVVPRSRDLAEVDAGLTVLEAGADLSFSSVLSSYTTPPQL